MIIWMNLFSFLFLFVVYVVIWDIRPYVDQANMYLG